MTRSRFITKFANGIGVTYEEAITILESLSSAVVSALGDGETVRLPNLCKFDLKYFSSDFRTRAVRTLPTTNQDRLEATYKIRCRVQDSAHRQVRDLIGIEEVGLAFVVDPD